MQKLPLFCLLLLVLSCTKNAGSTDQTSNNQSNGGQNQSHPVWPIGMGNYWVYQDSTFDNNGSFYAVSPSDTLKTTDSVTFQGKVFYGKDPSFITTTYFRQADDSTVEAYNPGDNASYSYFRNVKVNNTIIWNQDAIVSNEHIVTTLTGYTGVTNMYGYDCIKNERTQTQSGILNLRIVIYVKPGVGVVRYVYYVRYPNSGALNLYFTRTLVSYKVQ